MRTSGRRRRCASSTSRTAPAPWPAGTPGPAARHRGTSPAPRAAPGSVPRSSRRTPGPRAGRGRARPRPSRAGSRRWARPRRHDTGRVGRRRLVPVVPSAFASGAHFRAAACRAHHSNERFVTLGQDAPHLDRRPHAVGPQARPECPAPTRGPAAASDRGQDLRRQGPDGGDPAERRHRSAAGPRRGAQRPRSRGQGRSDPPERRRAPQVATDDQDQRRCRWRPCRARRPVAKTTGKAAAQKAAKARIAASKADKAKGAQTAAGKARAALSRTARDTSAASETEAAPSDRDRAEEDDCDEVVRRQGRGAEEDDRGQDGRVEDHGVEDHEGRAEGQEELVRSSPHWRPGCRRTAGLRAIRAPRGPAPLRARYEPCSCSASRSGDC